MGQSETGSSLLEQLRAMTVVVADTGELRAIERLRPQDATTNPSLIASAAKMPAYAGVVDEALLQAQALAGPGASEAEIATLAVDRLAVEFGRQILEVIPGRVSTEVDARLSWDTDATVARARRLIGWYEAAGLSRERVLIKIASTWEGIRAAEILEREGIHCNLTLLFGIHQAVACAEARVTLISPFVGRILDWYKKKTGRTEVPASEDPGVLSVTRVYNYYKKFGHETQVMGASFRNAGEIVALAGCDLLTIAPNLIDELSATTGPLPRRLDPTLARASDEERIPMAREDFERMHAQDEMSNEKLAEGIASFSKAIVELELALAERLRALRPSA